MNYQDAKNYAEKLTHETGKPYAFVEVSEGFFQVIEGGANDAPPDDFFLAGEQIPSEVRNKPRAKTRPVDVISFDDLMSIDYKPNWLIDGLIEKSDLGLIFGSSGGGKSFIVLEWCYCIAAGVSFHGKRTKKGNVLYVCGEGFTGIQKRLKALHETHHGIVTGLHLTRQSAAFMDDESAKSVRQTMDDLGDIDLVVIDTFHRNMGAGDENSAKDFAKFLQNIDIHIKSSGAAVVIVHHSGNDANGRSRGSSAIRAAMDVEFQVIKNDDDIVTLTNTKMKNFEPPYPMAFKFLPVGQSVVLEQTEIIEKKKAKSLSANASKALQCLKNAIELNGITPPKVIRDLFKDSPQNIPNKVVTLEQWRELAYDAITVDSDGKRQRQDALRQTFNRAKNTLFDGFYFGFHGEYIWIIKPNSSVT